MKIGRSVLEYAEQFALHKVPELDSAIMYILNVRSELIAYYERRGYKTGNHEPYPLDANVGLPLIPIKLIEMKRTSNEVLLFRLETRCNSLKA